MVNPQIKTELEPKDRIIFALDVPDLQSALPHLEFFSGRVGMIKVGLELFVAEGKPIVDAARQYGGGNNVMLDLKLHDVPITVQRAAASAARLRPDLLTIHSDGGVPMMEAAVKGSSEALRGTDFFTKVIAITVLTSLNDSDLNDIGFANIHAHDALSHLIENRARLAIKAGCHGVVAPAFAAKKIRRLANSFNRRDFVIVCPGISLSGKPNPSQKSSGTAEEAIENEADYVVIGRDLRDAEDKTARIAEFVKQIERGLKARGK